MANRQSRRKNKVDRENEKILDTVSTFDGDYKKVVLVAGIVIVIFCLFYFLTVYVLDKDIDISRKNYNTDAVISYSEIVAGRSFSMPEAEYLVLYYDRSDSELLSTFSSTVSNYRSDDKNLTLYYVDMSNAMNKKYASDKSNWNPASISELAINGPTLIHYNKGKVVNYIEGMTEVNEYLSK